MNGASCANQVPDNSGGDMGILKPNPDKGFREGRIIHWKMIGFQPFQIGMVIFQNGNLFCFSRGNCVVHRMSWCGFDRAQHLMIHLNISMYQD
jgi:hypothetical protein